MATPIIQSDQPSGAGLGTAAQGRNDLELNKIVNLSDLEPANSGGVYVCAFEDIPIGSVTVLNDPLTATPNFVPDIAGSYRVSMTVNGLDTSVEVFSVPLAQTQARIPSFEEELEYDGSGNAKGWHQSQDQWMRAVDAALGSGASTYERNFETTADQGTNAEEDRSSGIASFDGSALGVSVLLDDTVTAGTIDVRLKIAGATVLTATLDSATNPTQAIAASTLDAISVSAGDTVEVSIETSGLTTTGGLSPQLAINTMLASNAFVQPPKGADFLYGRMTYNQTTDVGIGTHFEWNAFSSRGTSITMTTGSSDQTDGLVTLQPGKVYKVTMNSKCTVDEGQAHHRWTNDSGGAAIVDDAGEDGPITVCIDDGAGGDEAAMPGSVMFFTPSVLTVLRYELIAGANLTSRDIPSNFSIEEVK